MLIQDGSHIYPLPEFVLLYPFAYGKTCSLHGFLPVRRAKIVKRITSPIVIDGQLNENAWTKTIPVKQLASYDGQPNPSVDKIEMYLCHDQDNFYISIIQEYINEDQKNTVKTIRLKIGKLTNVLTDSLLFGFEVLTKDTYLEGANLEIEHLPVRIRCEACGEETTIENFLFL